jgi:hypothetical protein
VEVHVDMVGGHHYGEDAKRHRHVVLVADCRLNAVLVAIGETVRWHVVCS